MAKKTKRRRLTGGYITHLSFVDRGANQVRPILKAEDNGGVEVTAKVASYDEKEGLLYSLVYGPEESGFVDAHGDSAPASVLKHFCHNFFRSGGGHLDEGHSFIDIEGAHVAENMIVQAGDRRFDGIQDYEGNPVDPTGWWGVILKIEDPALQARCESGEIAGISMAGAEVWVRDVSATSFTKALADRLGNSNNKEINMDEKTLAGLFAEAIKPLCAQIEAMKPATPVQKQEEKPEEKAIVIKFEGDASNPADVAAHKTKIFKSTCDFNTVEGVEKWEKYLASLKPVETKQVEKSEEETSKEIKELQDKLASLRKASTQDGKDVVNANETPDERRARICKSAKEIAAQHNKSNG